MNVLNLFDGISVGRLALEELGWEGKYFSSEIDNKAIALSDKNYPDVIQLGDVRNVKGEELPFIDLLMGGSPCQSFSQEGRRGNFDDPRGKLFWEFVRVLRETKPPWFLLENVPMNRESQDIISSYLGVEPVKINSAIFSPQNRERLYWSNIPIGKLPQDKGIVIKDILEEGVPSQGSLEKVLSKEINSQKMNKIGEADIPYNRERQKRVYDIRGKSPTLLSSSGKYNRPKISFDWETWRELTINECERLQSFPSNFSLSEKISENKRNQLIGNSWNLETIKFILSHLEFETDKERGEKKVNYGRERFNQE